MPNTLIPHNKTIFCPLCNGSSSVYYQYKQRLYHKCNNCYGIFIDAKLIVSSEAEINRYKEHNNDVEDLGYQKFVSPITKSILCDFTKFNKGLDFGAGTSSVISKILNDNSYQIVQYDPFFHNYPHLLKYKYDYIACCEVIEHFNNPHNEFALLKKLLLKKGKLYCMTEIYNESIDFHKWYYKNDPTHIFFYHKNTINWIKEEFGFFDATIEGRLITFC